MTKREKAIRGLLEYMAIEHNRHASYREVSDSSYGAACGIRDAIYYAERMGLVKRVSDTITGVSKSGQLIHKIQLHFEDEEET